LKRLILDKDLVLISNMIKCRKKHKYKRSYTWRAMSNMKFIHLNIKHARDQQKTRIKIMN